MALRYTAADIEAALRDMATERANTGGPASISVSWWSAHRDPARHPTSARVIQRYGSWNAACRAAGLPVTETATPRGRASRWDDEACLGWVRAFRASDAPGRSYAAFEAWLQTQPGSPSAQTVRNRLGAWSAALTRAAE